MLQAFDGGKYGSSSCRFVQPPNSVSAGVSAKVVLENHSVELQKKKSHPNYPRVLSKSVGLCWAALITSLWVHVACECGQTHLLECFLLGLDPEPRSHRCEPSLLGTTQGLEQSLLLPSPSGLSRPLRQV